MSQPDSQAHSGKMQRIWLKTATWLVAEIVLTLMGIDDLADYSEFVFELEVALGSQHPQSTLVSSANPPPRFRDGSLPLIRIFG